MPAAAACGSRARRRDADRHSCLLRGIAGACGVAVAIGACGGGRRAFVYSASTAIAAISLVAAAAHLSARQQPASLALPLGVPWLGAHFRLDALGAFFLLVIDLGALSASLFALGYGEHEDSAAARAAVLSPPFSPA